MRIIRFWSSPESNPLPAETFAVSQFAAFLFSRKSLAPWISIFKKFLSFLLLKISKSLGLSIRVSQSLKFTMPPFWSSTTSKAVGSLLSHRIGPRHLIRSGRKYDPVRCFSSIAGIETPSSIHKWTGDSRLDYNYRSRRQFLGCGDGEEGGVLSKVYEEKRVLG